MTLGHARSLLGGLQVEQQRHRPEEDRAALRRLARWMLKLAPIVSPDEPDGLMLDIAGCERLFGGPDAHVAMIVDALRGLGLRPRLALAPTVGCAWAVARCSGKEVTIIPPGQTTAALARLPVAALRVEAGTIEALRDVGVERIEQLLKLPRDELASRYGPHLLRRLDQATGEVEEKIDPLHAPPEFKAARVFAGPVARFEAIELTTRELLGEVLADLTAHGRGVLTLVIQFRCVDTGTAEVSITLTHPNSNARHVWAVLAPRLERANLGSGVEEMIVYARRTAPLGDRQSAFWPEAVTASSNPAAIAELVDQLAARLGEYAVTKIQPAETVLPEEAFVQLPIERIRPETHGASPAVNLTPADRPSQLFDRPEPVRVLSVVPGGPPLRITWRGHASDVIASRGPERLEAPWWRPQAQSGRDYFEIEDEQGRRLWLYRELRSNQWFVHGQWA